MQTPRGRVKVPWSSSRIDRPNRHPTTALVLSPGTTGSSARATRFRDDRFGSWDDPSDGRGTLLAVHGISGALWSPDGDKSLFRLRADHAVAPHSRNGCLSTARRKKFHHEMLIGVIGMAQVRGTRSLGATPPNGREPGTRPPVHRTSAGIEAREPWCPAPRLAPPGRDGGGAVAAGPCRGPPCRGDDRCARDAATGLAGGPHRRSGDERMPTPSGSQRAPTPPTGC
jgi:hypothetical protein